jgi:hypothetical protein
MDDYRINSTIAVFTQPLEPILIPSWNYHGCWLPDLPSKVTDLCYPHKIKVNSQLLASHDQNTTKKVFKMVPEELDADMVRIYIYIYMIEIRLCIYY